MRKIIPMACSFFCFLLIIVGLTSMRKNDNEIEIMHEGCDLKLNLEVTDNLPPFSLKLTVTNNLGKTIALPMYCYMIFDTYWNVTTNNFFHIENEKGISPKYCGIFKKIAIGSATLDNCIILDKDQSIIIEIPDLMNSYNFENFDYKELHIQYGGWFGTRSWLGRSNEVIIKAEDINGK